MKDPEGFSHMLPTAPPNFTKANLIMFQSLCCVFYFQYFTLSSQFCKIWRKAKLRCNNHRIIFSCLTKSYTHTHTQES